MKQFLTTAVLISAVGGTQAATLISSDISGQGGAAGSQIIDVTGSNVVDWGYYLATRNDFKSNSTPNNTKAVSGIGGVAVTAGPILDSDAVTFDPVATSIYKMSFDDGTSPTTGAVQMGAGFGGWAPGENNAVSLAFTDLGAGTHTIRLYWGHQVVDRVFDVDHSIVASDGNVAGNTLGTKDNQRNFFYALVFSTTDVNADVTLQLNSTSGGSGRAFFAGYTVETVPEPGSLALLGLGGLLVARRRRG